MQLLLVLHDSKILQKVLQDYLAGASKNHLAGWGLGEREGLGYIEGLFGVDGEGEHEIWVYLHEPFDDLLVPVWGTGDRAVEERAAQEDLHVCVGGGHTTSEAAPLYGDSDLVGHSLGGRVGVDYHATGEAAAAYAHQFAHGGAGVEGVQHQTPTRGVLIPILIGGVILHLRCPFTTPLVLRDGLGIGQTAAEDAVARLVGERSSVQHGVEVHAHDRAPVLQNRVPALVKVHLDDDTVLAALLAQEEVRQALRPQLVLDISGQITGLAHPATISLF
mmetsp:Transcript_7703/g.16841  ORF Transcript_7703/g.16841 Transcript_7703/m.16841 type:complete len:276 (+) Transcript_7703:579-1406(+)